jgi:hypothetical protein
VGQTAFDKKPARRAPVDQPQTVNSPCRRRSSPEEADRFTAHRRPLVEQGHGHQRITASHPEPLRSTD